MDLPAVDASGIPFAGVDRSRDYCRIRAAMTHTAHGRRGNLDGIWSLNKLVSFGGCILY
jgi:hypothetical protein